MVKIHKSLVRDAYETVDWAIDLLKMYDEKLIDLGEPEEKVRSEVHMNGLRKAMRIRDKLGALLTDRPEDPDEEKNHG